MIASQDKEVRQMTFAEKLKSLRKGNGMSQETLAEKIGVSRQAVTKWETDGGVPDIENMISISNLFGITLDELLSEKIETAISKGYLYESTMEYDIDGYKRFDMKLGGACLLRAVGTDGEKVMVHLASNDISTLESDFKVKIDDIKGRIDVDIKRKNGMTEAKAKESLVVEVMVPNKYMDHLELESNCHELRLNNIVCGNTEFKGKTSNVIVDSVESVLELDCNLNMDIKVDHFAGSLEINQISSTSRLMVPDTFAFQTVLKGLSNSISYECGGSPADDFSDPDSKNVVELNGLRSELAIVREA